MVYRLVIDSAQQQNEKIHLTSQQQHYLSRVLRLRKDDRFVAMDGRGKSWVARLVGTSAQIIEPLSESTELPIAVTLMTALPKGNGFEEIVRCCTELGTMAFMPTISDRTLLNPSTNKLERWRKIATEAAEQSERQIVPVVLEPIDFAKALIEVDDLETDRYICVTRIEANHLLTYLREKPPKNNLVIATGPEGGWTEAEVKGAIAAGFAPVSLGRRILRAITAPIVAVSVVAASVEQPITNQ
ncbi:RNA methyltransferase, RsmE family [Pleurocapsa sp. PCC 7327]|uniref:16S rRNA (uracil(1498)-N(3))-methyltransferase n=1 Tax=Pleurocapsa sp. PCC 7327 TaxID=118163 RepID=UPI00029FEB2D|nr:16S rRNA (uracil(1498)-N(3))-methyltransferase [Pleurocapsa sp. PCC 7327]AFY77277.1 RNA methyltransferase, RsmE family [Pleurocapsa sp. PCC 7327]